MGALEQKKRILVFSTGKIIQIAIHKMLQHSSTVTKSDVCDVDSKRVGGTTKPRQAKRGVNAVSIETINPVSDNYRDTIRRLSRRFAR